MGSAGCLLTGCCRHNNGSLFRGAHMKLGRLLATCCLLLSLHTPASAAEIMVNFGGLFTNTFSGGPLYPTNTGYYGDFSFSTELLPTVTTLNQVGTFARFTSANPYHLTIGSDQYTGTVEFVTNDINGGTDSLRAFLNLGNGNNFAVGYFALPGSTINGAALPDDLSALSRPSQGSISNARMQGNFGLISALAYVAPVAAVPETSTWAMMILGFLAVGFALRRGARPRKACGGIIGYSPSR